MTLKTFLENMCSSILPDCFELKADSYRFTEEKKFADAVDDTNNFAEFVAGKWNHECLDSYCDSFYSGFLGSFALALWFMEFDEDNWFSFKDVHRETERYLNSVSSVQERRELRLFKGSFEPMKLDLPVVVDYAEMSITVWTGSLND